MSGQTGESNDEGESDGRDVNPTIRCAMCSDNENGESGSATELGADLIRKSDFWDFGPMGG